MDLLVACMELTCLPILTPGLAEVKRPLALVVIRVPESPLTPLPDLPIPEAPSGVTNSTHVVVIDLRYEVRAVHRLNVIHTADAT
jgi:hypothetical protein